ncbi:DUF4386 domain-containing protein [Candidatus Uabimicrobium sp. HlEnr_7]|uniref:DUF4386 domain-containing protein n=1 Tax=Candidatus Uabimicrobium helgolandensis TaxID=3095367 RepID=UPI003558613A
MNNIKLAKITGWSLILMALISGFSVGYAYQELYQPEQFSLLKDNLAQNIGLYKYMLVGILLILILDLLVSYTLFIYFKNDNKKISLVSAILRIIYTVIFGVATYYLTNNLNINKVDNQLIQNNFQLFQSIWSVGLIVFGVHIVLVGILMKLHKRILKILWCLTLIAGMSYIVVHFIKLNNPHSELADTLEMILALPMALGELGLAIWLLIKGGKEHL